MFAASATSRQRFASRAMNVAKILRRADVDAAAEPRDVGLHFRRAQHVDDRGVELVDDRGGVCAGTTTPLKLSTV